VSGWDRSAHAHHRGLAPPRLLHAEFDQGLLRAHRRGQERQHGGAGPPRALCPRRPQQARRGAAWPSFAPSSSSWRTIRGQGRRDDAVNNPEDPSAGTRRVPFSRELWIEQAISRGRPQKYFRLASAPRFACATPISSSAPTSRKTPRRDRRGAMPVRSLQPSGATAKGRSVKGTHPLGVGPHATQAEVGLRHALR